MKDYIILNNVCHHYTGLNDQIVKALDHISLTIQEGEFLAVIGSNGSGKSTMAKHLNALLVPTDGDCIVQGMNTKDEENIWNIRQNVGMVFQNPDNQIVAAIVEEDIAFGPENLGLPSAEIVDRVNQALVAVNMEEYRQHAPHLLSGGQKQRVAIAGIIAMRPRCLVLDEPTAMLDPQGRQEVLKTVIELNRKFGITVVYITHFMEEAVCADRVVVMDSGRVVMTGKPKEIFCLYDQLTGLGLDVPVAAEMASRLRQLGLPLPEQIITNEELVVELCRLNSKM